MGHAFFSILLFPVLFIALTHSALTPQEHYWRAVLPNTLMPRTIRDMLQIDGKPNFALSTKDDNTTVSLQRCRITLRYCLRYGRKADAQQIPKNSDTSLFFLYKDLHLGAKMEVDFTKSTLVVAFISRKEANSIPFSSKKLPEILRHFSFQPNSLEAETMKQTLESCERDNPLEESKTCATSLESMINFAISTLGTHNVKAVTTELVREGVLKQQYTVASPVRELAGNSSVGCHSVPYPYRVFFCHVTHASRTYEVSLVGKDGNRVNAIAVCHTDTSAWDPNYVGFQVLNIKPGTVPVCHFLPQDHIVWIPLKKTAP